MKDSLRIRWHRSIRTKILLPAVALFTLFVVIVIAGAILQFTGDIESKLVAKLEESGLLMDALIRDEEARTALHARFMADMVQLSEQLSGSNTGRSALIYLLDYMREAGIEIDTYHVHGQLDGPYGALLRRGALGIRATGIVLTEEMDDVGLGIASVAPIGTNDIRDVVVGVYRLTEARLQEIKEKIGVDITLVYGANVVTSTLVNRPCRRRIAAVMTDEVREAILEHDGPLIRDLDCTDAPQKMIARPLEIGFKHEAVYALSVSLEELRATKRRVFRDTLLVAGLILIAAVAIYSLLIRKLTQPMQDLAALSRRVALRDFSGRAVVTTRDEIGALGDSYNAMIERLAASQKEIEELHQRELERTQRLANIGELASGIAHEVRNPLAGISGAMQVLKHEGRMSGDREEILDEVLKQIARLEKLTRDLMEYSKPSLPQLQSSDLREILDKAVFLAAMGQEDAKVSIEKEYDPDLPPVLVDPEQIQQVFLNILINAVQAIPGQGTVVVRTLRTKENGRDRVCVEFEDDGVGMTEETLKQAQRPFFTTKHQGTGLGLSIVRQIMENHEGVVQIDSEVGRGTTLSLLFPVAPA